MAKLAPTWAAKDTKVLALSCDPVDKHHSWQNDIEETQACGPVTYPIIADESRHVATLFNMLDKVNKDKAGLPLTVRSVFIINPAREIKLILTYPAAVGRNFAEVLRCLEALQLTAGYACACAGGGVCLLLPGPLLSLCMLPALAFFLLFIVCFWWLPTPAGTRWQRPSTGRTARTSLSSTACPWPMRRRSTRTCGSSSRTCATRRTPRSRSDETAVLLLSGIFGPSLSD